MLARHSAIYLGGRVVSGAVALASIAVFTRVLTPSEYGEYSLIVAAASLIAAMVFQWLRQGLVRFLTVNVADDNSLLATIMVSFLILTLGLVALAGLLWVGLLHALHLTAFLVLTVVLTVSLAWFELDLALCRSRLASGRYSWASVIRSFLMLVLGSLGASLWNVYGLIFGVALAYLISTLALPLKTWLDSLNSGGVNIRDIKRIAAFGLPLSATLILVFFLESADRFFLAYFRGSTEVGIYSAAYNLAQYSIGSLLVSLNLAGFPLLVKFYEAGNDRMTRQRLSAYLSLGGAVGIPAVVGIIVLARPLGKLILGNYQPDVTPFVLIVVAPAILFAGMKSYYVDFIFMLRKVTVWQVYTSGAAATVNIGLNLLLIPKYGAFGAAISTLFAFALALGLGIPLARRLYRIPLFNLDLVKEIIASGVMAGVIVLLNPRGSWPIIISVVGLALAVYVGVLFVLRPERLIAIIREW